MIAVETPEAVAAIDEIVKVDGLDGVFIGPMDLASSMGYFGDASGPEVQEAIKKVEKSVLAAGKVFATTTSAWEQARTLFERGLSNADADGRWGFLSQPGSAKSSPIQGTLPRIVNRVIRTTYRCDGRLELEKSQSRFVNQAK